MTPTATLRQQLAKSQERSRNARAVLNRANQAHDAAKAAGDEDAIAVTGLVAEEARIERDTAEALEKQTLGMMAGVNGSGHGRGEDILSDPQTIEALERMGNSASYPIGAVNLGPLGTVESTVAMVESGSWKGGVRAQGTDVTVPDSARLGAYYGVVPQLRRRLSILDLIPVSPMTGRSFGYMQEGGSFNAAEVPEGALKPEGDIELTEAEVVAATIAVWKKLRRQELADVPSLAQTINDRLQYSCMRRLEDQVIGGDGTGENILGILNTPGISTIPFDAAAAASDLVLDGVTEVAENDSEPDAVVLEPSDLNAMLKAVTQGSGERLDSDGAFSALPATLWGYPAIASNVVPAGQVAGGRVRGRKPGCSSARRSTCA